MNTNTTFFSTMGIPAILILCVITPLGADASRLFDGIMAFAAGDGPVAVAIEDMEGDGVPDLPVGTAPTTPSPS